MRRGPFLVLLVSLSLVVTRCSCIDLATPRQYPCALDGGEAECPNGWRCGLEGYCHAKDDPKPYACASDLDCEAKWRCGPEGRCVNAEEESLRVTADAGTVMATLLSPRLFSQPPSQVATGASQYMDGGCGRTLRSFTVTALVDAGVKQFLVYPEGRAVFTDGGFADYCDPEATLTFLFESPVTPNVPPALAMAEEDQVTYLLDDGGTLCRLPFQGNTTPVLDCLPNAFGFAPSALRVTHETAPRVLGFDETQYATFYPSAGLADTARSVNKLDAGVAKVFDLVEVGTSHYWLRYLLALTPNGLFMNSTDVVGQRTWDAGPAPITPWEPVALENTICEDSQWFGGGGEERGYPVRIKILGGMNEQKLAVQLRNDWDGGFREWISFHHPAAATGYSGGCPPLPDPQSWWFGGEKRVFRLDGKSCSLCPADHHIEDFHASPRAEDETSSDSVNYDIIARCVPVDGGTSFAGIATGGNCRYPPEAPLPSVEQFDPPAAFSLASPYRSVSAGPSGAVWYADEDGLGLKSLTLNRAPSVVVGDGEELLAHTPELLYGGLGEVKTRLMPDQTFELRPHGFVLELGNLREVPLFASVDNRERWAIAGRTDIDPPFFGVLELPKRGDPRGIRILGLLTDTDVFKAPFHAAAAQTPDGGTTAVVTSFDALLAADVSARDQDPDSGYDNAGLYSAPRLEVKLIPLSRSPITSLMVLPPDTQSASPPMVQGYLLTAGRAFRFTAQNPTVRRADELVLPDGEPLELFNDGRRARVAYRDGTVWSLPSRVQLATALPTAAQPAQDFAAFCQHTMALGADGVYRLSVTDGVMGEWEKVTLDETMIGTSPSPFVEGKLHAGSGSVTLFLRTGRAIQLSGLSCEP